MRLSALELREPVKLEPYGAPAPDHLQLQVERLQQGSVAVAAGLSELHGRQETEVKARAQAQAQQEQRLEALGQVVNMSRHVLQQSVQQRLEAIEERLGADQKELANRQVRLREEVASDNQEQSL